jgi:hypothetical protein
MSSLDARRLVESDEKGLSLSDIVVMMEAERVVGDEYDLVCGLLRDEQFSAEVKLQNICKDRKVRKTPKKLIRNLNRLKNRYVEQGALHNVTKMMEEATGVVDSLDAMINKVDRILKFSTSDDIKDAAVKRIEQFFLTLYAMSQQSSVSGILSVLLLYVQTWCKSSLTKTVMDQVKGILASCSRIAGYKEQSGWLTNNWKTLVDGPFGMAMSKIISLMIVVGFLPEKATTNLGRGMFEMLKVRRFSDDGASLPTVIEYTLTTIDWVVDVAWPAAVTGNPDLLFTTQSALALDESYRRIVDCTDLYMSAQYGVLKDKYGLGDSGMEIIKEIDDCYEKHLEEKKVMGTHPAHRAEMEKRLLALNRFSCQVQSSFRESSIRVRPYTFLIRGGSGINKTQLNNLLLHVIRVKNGLPEGAEYHCQFNEGDEYMSDFKSKHVTLTWDDICNTKPEHESLSPLSKIIQFINNVHCTALSAEAHLKGKKDINVKVCSATTNTVDLHSGYFSCNPASIMSRWNLIIDVTLKETALDPQGKIDEKYIGIQTPDMWNIVVNWVKVKHYENLKDVWSTVPYEIGNDLANVMEFVADDSYRWFNKQKRLVDAARELHKLPHCHKHPIFPLPCLKCAKLENERKVDYKEEADDFSDDVSHSGLTFASAFAEPRNFVIEENHDAVIENLRSFMKTDDRPITQAEARTATLAVLKEKIFDISSFGIEKLRLLKDDLANRDPNYKAMALAAAVMAAGVAAHSLYRKLDDQASIEQVNALAMPPEMVVKRDNMYQKPIRMKANFPEASRTATQGQFIDKIDMSLHHVTVIPVMDHEGTLGTCGSKVCSFPVGDGYWMLPKHAFKHESPIDQWQVSFVHTVGLKKTFKEIVPKENLVQVAGSDIVIVRVVAGGCNYDFTKFVQQEERTLRKGTKVQIFPKDSQMVNNFITPSQGVIIGTITDYSVINVRGKQYYAAEYTTNVTTYDGLCGAPVVTTGPNPMIIGIHTAGKEGMKSGACAVFTQEDIVKPQHDGIKLLDKGEVPTESLGVKFNLRTDAKWKSAVNWVPNSTEVSADYLGEHDLPTSRFKTSVEPSILVEALETIGIKREHAGPLKTAETMARQEHLVNCGAVLPSPNPVFKQRAVDDLKAKLKAAMVSSNQGDTKFKDYVHPLSYEQALNGVPGVAGFDPIPADTAPGFGRSGPKYLLLIQEAVDEKMKGHCPRLYVQKQNEDGILEDVLEYQFDPEKFDVRASVESLFENFENGIRSNIIMKCNLKDEALPLDKVLKGKLRVFAGAPMNFVIATRMIFSPLNVLMTQLPTLFESAVGVNAQGKDWDFLGKYISSFGEDRVFGGDFSKYDQRMRSNFSIEAMGILKFVLKESGYPDELLNVVDGIACEVCYPIYDINGVLVQIDGSGPSGHPLTVIVNGIVNALMMRYCYYAMHMKRGTLELPLFHQVVALMTYGDDNVCSVSNSDQLFNHLSVAYEMSLLGMKYTMPDKDSAPTAFIPFENIDFLKRKFRKHEVTGTYIGALEKNSIFKSLTTTMRRKGCEESRCEIMAGNVANALTELWAHGPEVFDEYKAKFECLKDVKDGHLSVGQFWREVTHESCLERYESTTCAYVDAMKKLSIPYDDQAEELEYMDWTPHLVPDDYRYDPHFKNKILHAYCIQRRKVRWRKRNAREIERAFAAVTSRYLWLKAQYSIVLKREIIHPHIKACKLVCRLLYKNALTKIEPKLPLDVVEHVLTYNSLVPEVGFMRVASPGGKVNIYYLS